MEMVAILATIILIATLATLIFAFAAYFITKAKRNKSKKVTVVEKSNEKPQRKYFERYLPDRIPSQVKDKFKGIESEEHQWT